MAEVMKRHLFAFAAIAIWSASAVAAGDDDLRAALERRFKNDRTGACVAAALIDNGTTATAYYCANPKSQRPYDERNAFEIGSISKTMTAALVADLVVRGETTLGDPIAKLLPAGTSVPSFKGREVTIGDIVTHVSGLPRISVGLRMTNMNNPYASVTERDLLQALAATQLTRAPGSQWEYSNFAMMVLSYALAKQGGKDFETLLRERLLVPLGMTETYIAARPPQIRLVQGHLANTVPTVPWDFPIDMAGVGGVRATLPDMVRYLEGQLGTRESAITPALRRTQDEVARVGGHRMGMNWMISTQNGRTVHAHGGDTGGYSAYAAFDRAAKRAVVLLSDTALASVGGLGAFGMHVLDPTAPAGVPRVVAMADSKVVDGLVGTYRLPNGLGMALRRKGDALTVQADHQPEFQMGYDSAGDFYPLEFDALLRPKRRADGTYTFTWFQLGGVLEAERVGAPLPSVAKWMPTESQLKDYDGTYPLMPNFSLRVFSAGSRLYIQGTNQGAIEVVAAERDIFVAESVGAEIGFERDASDKVISLTLKQHGQVLRGERH